MKRDKIEKESSHYANQCLCFMIPDVDVSIVEGCKHPGLRRV